MKSFSTIVSGKEMSRFIRLPDDLQEGDLKISIRPVQKDKDRFAKLFQSPIKVKKIVIPSKDKINER
ncbi:hypothetical protein [Desulfobacterium sp. N47]|uniref:Uncharacterized protein n=1 Tax=uncultured Desulfobacterium sp. TaxID=201089 RepID=E1YJR9_9BACT|nr:unknown protein [uncultured Desulfobacterium sp.]